MSRRRETSSRSVWPIWTGVLLAQSTGTFPTFLLGALAVLIRRDLEFEAGQLGIAVSMFFVASTILSVPIGILCDRLGPRRSFSISVTATALSLLGMATIASSWVGFAMMTFVAGAANAMTQPSTNLAIARGISRHRGLAFGVKQSAVPLGSMMAGASVPVLGVAYGWRSALFAGALVVVIIAIALRFLMPEQMSVRPSTTGVQDAPMRGMVMLSVAILFANMAVTSMGAFFVESAVHRGNDPSTAGALLVICSLAMIAGRLISGTRADRRPGNHLRAIALMMVVGSIGYFLLASMRAPTSIAFAGMIAFGVGWGWTGLFHFAVVSLNPGSPARATGISSVGLRVGGILGPASFGAIAERLSFAFAWRTMAVMLLISSGLLFVVRVVFRRGGATYADANVSS